MFRQSLEVCKFNTTLQNARLWESLRASVINTVGLQSKL